MYAALVGNTFSAETRSSSTCAIKQQPLLDALTALGIKPLDADAVAAFKKKVVTRLTILSNLWLLGSSPSLLVSAIGSTLTGAGIFSIPRPEWGAVPYLFAFFCAWCLSALVIDQLARRFLPKNVPAMLIHWECTPFGFYKRHVPDSARLKAVNIQRLCPEVDVFVDELKIIPDPFLFVRLEDELYWVEQWE